MHGHVATAHFGDTATHLCKRVYEIEGEEIKKRSEVGKNHISVYINYKEFIITTVASWGFFLSENYKLL